MKGTSPMPPSPAGVLRLRRLRDLGVGVEKASYRCGRSRGRSELCGEGKVPNETYTTGRSSG